MARINREYLWLGLLFAATLALHLALSAQVSTLDSESYFVLRQADHIRHTGLPLFSDPLSYSGRVYLFQPLFHYLVAFFSFFTQAAVAGKIVQALCASAMVIIVYLIARHLTKNRTIAFISGMFAGFIPAAYTGLASLSPTSLSLALAFLLIYLFLRIEEEGMASFAIIVAVLSLLTSASLFILLFGILFYFIILGLEKMKPSTREGELATFLFFLAFWFDVLIYKKSFFYSGISTLWSNLPPALIENYFRNLSFLDILYSAGIVPLFLGVYGVYYVMFESKNRSTMLFVGIALSSFMALWLRLVPVEVGLAFLSTSVIILSSHTMKASLAAASKMRIKNMGIMIYSAIILLFIITTVPALIGLAGQPEPQSQDDINALLWLKENTNESAVVLGRVREGFMISYFAERKNVADPNFLFLKEPDQTFSDVEGLYRLHLLSEAVRLLNKHSVNYVFFSTKTKKEYSINTLPYFTTQCFDKVYDRNATIYLFEDCKI